MNENITLTYNQLVELLVRAGKEGFNSYETHEAGLEAYDAGTTARWIALGFISNQIKIE